MSDSELPYGVVIYTDGSARPNPGFFGSGLHGYLYRLPEGDEKPTKINSLIATDAGYILQNDLEKKDALPVVVTEYIDSYSASLGNGTNNVAEINAVTLFFEHYPEIGSTIKKLHVVADSKYAIEGATSWLPGWIRNNWIKSTGEPVNNREHWEKLSKHLGTFKTDAKFSMSWVRGHNDDYGNVKADYLAGIATNHSTDGLDTQFKLRSIPLRYHKVDVDVHPMLGFKRIYFNTDPEFNTPGLYYQTSWSGPSYILGKRTSEAAFSVVKLETPDTVLDTIIATQCAVPCNVNSVVYVKMDRLRSADVFPWIKDHGKYCLIPDKRNANLNFLDFKPVTIEVLAGELPLRAIDVLNHLEEVLERFQVATQNGDVGVFELGTSRYQLHDITSHFYTTIQKKVGKTTVDQSELAKNIVINMKKTEIVINESYLGQDRSLTLPLIFMDDIPARNTFKHLEPKHPKVFLVTWKESPQLLRYATIIKTDDGVGIWSNYFANQLLLF